MSIPLNVNGVEYTYPEVGDTNWGSQATAWASAVTSGMLQKAGGSFTLTAEVDFGGTYGLKSAYFKTQTANNASAGAYRLARTDVVSWRNQANGANLDLAVNASDILTFNGEVIPAGEIVNADISASAAIAFSKMAALPTSVAVVTDGSGVVTTSATTATQIGYLSTTTGDVQVALNARLPLAGGTMTGDLFLNANPSSDNQAATKGYVDASTAGIVNRYEARLATTANISIATDLENGDTLDGETIATGDIILVKNQATQSQNGLYVAPASGAASRATIMDNWTEVVGAFVFVQEGTANAGTGWTANVAAGGTIGVTNMPWTQNSTAQVYTADGLGLELTGFQFGLELDGTTLSKSGTGLKVNEIDNAQIAAAAAVAVNKLAALTASRAVVSDGSGFISAATTTSTEIGYVNGVTSAIQTQLDAKIDKTLTTTRGDMIYASAANTPARLAVGTSGYIIQSDGTDPVWTNPKNSGTWFVSNTAYSVQTSFTALTLVAVTDSWGTPCTRSSNTFQFAFTGRHIIYLSLGYVQASSGRLVMARIRNTTDSTTLATTMAVPLSGVYFAAPTFMMEGNVSDVSKVYEVQLAASGTGVSVNTTTIDSQVSHVYQLLIFRPPQ